MNIAEEKSLISFRAICNFINDLAQEYGKRHKPLLLYKRLINHTQIAHDKAIKKHVTTFSEFCSSNREALSTQDSSKLTTTKLEYSDRVYIDMKFIFHIADSETSPVIWQHLLTISALLDPSGNAKDILRKQAEDSKSGGEEAKFINDIINKVQDHIKPDLNAMETMTNVLKSGGAKDIIFTITGGLRSGKLDLKKMLGALKNELSKFEGKDTMDADTAKTLGIVNQILGSMSGEGGEVNTEALLQMAMSAISSIGMNSDSAGGASNPLAGLGGGDVMSLLQNFGPLIQSMTSGSQNSIQAP
jgi:hypothetical protein